MAYGEHKRTVTVTFEVTHHQCNQLRALGRTLWPDRNLSYQEVCRRVLLEGADRMRGTSNGDKLLEVVCQPSQRPSIIQN
jgi:hypothetical protein